MTDPNALSNFARATVAAAFERGPDPGAPRKPEASYGGGGEEHGIVASRAVDQPSVEPEDAGPDGGAEPGLTDEAAGGSEFEGMTAREAFDSLSDEVLAAISDDPVASEEWRQALLDEGEPEPVDEAAETIGTFKPTGPEVAQLVLADPAWTANTGLSPEAWLEWAATAPADEWAAACADLGWPVESRPSRNDWPVDMRWDDEMERRREMIAAGDKRGYFGS
jgi:hypothetical protein